MWVLSFAQHTPNSSPDLGKGLLMSASGPFGLCHFTCEATGTLDVLDLSTSHVEPYTNQVSGFLLHFLQPEQGGQPHLSLSP